MTKEKLKEHWYKYKKQLQNMNCRPEVLTRNEYIILDFISSIEQNGAYDE